MNQKLKHLLFGILIAMPMVASAQDIEINETNFPDENFRNYLLEQDYGADGVITEEEIKGISYMYFFENLDIHSLQGVEFFTNLTDFVVIGNPVTSLDLSKNTALRYLNCNECPLTSLDVSGCTELDDLRCYNTNLASLDVSGCTALTCLFCPYNQLTSLDASGCTDLGDLQCYNNRLSSLDVSGCTALTSLICMNNQLTSLEVSGCTELNNLVCCYNQLAALDVSECTALTSLSCEYNQLTSLDVAGHTSLVDLYCWNNRLEFLDVSGCTALTQIFCPNQFLTSLKVSGCTSATRLDCNYNMLSSLDVSGCTELTTIYCNQNMIQGISMDAFIESLPINTNNEEHVLIVVSDVAAERNVCTKSNVTKAKAKGWIVMNERYEEIEGVESQVVITDAEYTAYVTEYNVDFTKTEGLTAYKVTNATVLYATLEEIENATKGTAVILYGEPNTYELYPTLNEIDKDLDNLFYAGGRQYGDGSTIYALGNKSKGVGFYLVKDGVLVPADKGYLQIYPTNEAKEFIPFGSEATGVEAITEESAEKDAVIYNLAGQRVAQPTKSGIYIVNGKKVLINK